MKRRPLVTIHEAAEDGDAGGNDSEGGLSVSPEPEVNRIGCISLVVSVIPARRGRLWTRDPYQNQEKAWLGIWRF